MTDRIDTAKEREKLADLDGADLYDMGIILLDALDAKDSEIERMREALTPSADTKAAYIGEFHMGITLRARTEEDYRRIEIPWTTIKEVMAAIRARAALNPENHK